MVNPCTVALAGLETLKNADGSFKKFSVTFLNNIYTWKLDHPKEDVVIVDARDFWQKEDPMSEVMWCLREVSSKKPISTLIYSGHSDPVGLYFFSKVRKELEEDKRYFIMGRSWEGVNFTEKARIHLLGCQAGGVDGKKYDVCIAQDIADNTRRDVYAFVSKSSQRRIGKKYYQVPDIKGARRFAPKSLGEIC